MRKIIAVLMSLLLALSATACSSADNADNVDNKESSQSSSLTEAPSETTSSSTEEHKSEVIEAPTDYFDENFPSYDDIQAQYPDKTVLVWAFEGTMWEQLTPFRSKEINEYLDSLGCDFAVCFKPVWGSATNDQNTYYNYCIEEMIADGEQLDLVNVLMKSAEEGIPNAYHHAVQRGLFAPLDEYFDTEAGRALYDVMPANHWETLRVNGSIYGVEGNMDSTGLDYGYYVNKELADKYGYDLSKPAQEQLDIIREVNEKEYVNYSAFVFDKGHLEDPIAYFTSSMAITPAVYWDDEQHTARCALDNPEYLEKLSFFDMLSKEGLLSYAVGGSSRLWFIAQTNLTGGYAAYHDSTEPIELYYQTFDNLGKDNIVEVYPVFSEPRAVQASYCATGICSASQNKDKAFELLALAQTDPYLNNLMVYGIEGTDYNLTEEGKSADLLNAFSYYRYANLMICIKSDYPYRRSPDVTAEEYKALYENAVVSEDIDFAFDGRGLEKEIYATNLIMGSFSLPGSSGSLEEALAELRERLENSGLQKIIDECNQQYEEYKNGKNEN